MLKTEILHFLSLKSAAYKREQLQIASGLWWRAYGSYFFQLYKIVTPFRKDPWGPESSTWHPLILVHCCSANILHYRGLFSSWPMMLCSCKAFSIPEMVLRYFWIRNWIFNLYKSFKIRPMKTKMEQMVLLWFRWFWCKMFVGLGLKSEYWYTRSSHNGNSPSAFN